MASPSGMASAVTRGTSRCGTIDRSWPFFLAFFRLIEERETYPLFVPFKGSVKRGTTPTCKARVGKLENLDSFTPKQRKIVRVNTSTKANFATDSQNVCSTKFYEARTIALRKRDFYDLQRGKERKKKRVCKSERAKISVGLLRCDR